MESKDTKTPRRPYFFNTVAHCEAPIEEIDETEVEATPVAEDVGFTPMYEPAKPSLFDRFMDVVMDWPKLPYPGAFEGLQGPVRRVLMVDQFDGFRFDLSKQMSPKFQISHYFMLGTSQIPPQEGAGMYNFSTMLQHGNQMTFPNTMWTGNLDWSGRVSGRIITQWHPKFGTKVNGQIASSLAESQLQLESTYKGSDHDITMKYIPSQGYFEGGYLQSISRALAVGCGGVVIPARNVFVKSFGARFAGRGYTGVANVTYTPQGNEYSLGYVRNVSKRTSLAADFVMSKSMMGKFESQYSAGYNFKLKQASLSAKISSDGTLISTLQEQTAAGYTFSLSAAMPVYDPNRIKFGFGFSFGGQ